MEKMKKAFVWIGIIVFILCIPINAWLMYYHMFLKDSFTLTTNYVDKMTYSEEDKFFIEVEYFPNCFGVKLNYYTDTDIPEKDENGKYGNKYTYSSGVQFDGGYQYTRSLYSNYFTYDYYSFIYIQFFPCINSTENNNHCKTMEQIDFYLNNTFICFEMEDVELTPQNYTSPVRERNLDIYFTVGKKLFQEIQKFLLKIHFYIMLK